MTKNKFVLLFVFICAALLTVGVRNIPFFWDGIYFSKAASLFYHGNSSFFDCGKYTDNTMLPLYSAYLALTWSIFSKSLWVSHFVFLPFVLWLFYETYRFAKKYLNPFFCSLSLLLLFIEPTVITQSILMGYDIILACMFIFSLNRRIEKQNLLFSVGLSVLALFSIRGLFLVFSLFFVDWIIKKQDKENVSFLTLIKPYMPAIFLVSIWLIYHKTKTGWFLFSPLHESTDESFVSASMAMRQLIYVLWKNLDFGRVFLWLVVIVFVLKNKTQETTSRTITVCLFIPLFITALFMAVVSNPIGHKYFIFLFPLLIVLFSFCLQQLSNKKTALLFVVMAFFFLLSGNFWLYPQKYGNGWDSSLKVLPFFDLKLEMDDFIEAEKIEKNTIATQFPLDTNNCYSYLADSAENYTNVETEKITDYKYFLYSSVMNPRKTETIEYIRKTWVPIKTMSRGLITLCLYKKP